MTYSRYAVYYLPPDGALALFGAAWLGWDVAKGQAVDQPSLPGLETATEAPRKYGFHATLKPPFRLADGRTVNDLKAVIAQLAQSNRAVSSGGLMVSRLGRFLALTAQGDTTGINTLAATCVRDLDSFRAPLTPAELERRRKSHLSPTQERLLLHWGYPYVMEEFRFHLTLTGRLPRSEIEGWQHRLSKQIPSLPSSFVIGDIALVGERPDGRFEKIQRFSLAD